MNDEKQVLTIEIEMGAATVFEVPIRDVTAVRDRDGGTVIVFRECFNKPEGFKIDAGKF